MPPEIDHLHVRLIVSTFNRRATTETFYKSLNAARAEVRPHRVTAFFIDDASNDGTLETLVANADRVSGDTVLRTTGNFYWARAMSKAMTLALTPDVDYLILMNDDVELSSDSLSRLFELAEIHPLTSIVGAVKSEDAPGATYSGLQRLSKRPTALAMVEPSMTVPTVVDTFHGNCVMIPASVLRQVGVVDAEFEHAYGDIDLGLRISEAGYSLILAPGFVGFCSRNPKQAYLNPDVARRERLIDLFGRKGNPVRSHLRYFRRHGGRRWPAYAFASYGRSVSRIALKK